LAKEYFTEPQNMHHNGKHMHSEY